MKLSDALNSLSPTRGVTTVINAVMSGNTALASGRTRTVESVTDARARLAASQKQQRECQSDWEYWAHEGDIAYWSAVCHLLEAAAITGPDSLPDIPHQKGAPTTVMARCAAQVHWGKQVPAAAKASCPRAS